MILQLLLASLCLLQCLKVATVTTNRTIDDTFGDSVTGAKPSFMPNTSWDGPSCLPSKCAILPPQDQAFGRTYSATTYFPGKGARTAQFSFTGTDIYVFFILANNISGAVTETFCKFILDGQASGPDFHHAPSQSPDYQYNAPVYSKNKLPNVDHTLQITADGYSTGSYINFDYAIYTFDDGTSSAGNKSPTGAIVGGVVGGILLLLLLLGVVFLLRRRRQRIAMKSSTPPSSGRAVVTPFTPVLPTTQTSETSETMTFMAPQRKGQDMVRSQRQNDINHQISGLTREMHETMSMDSTAATQQERSMMSRLVEQSAAMQAQIGYLQAQLHSDWALGLSNNPPPGYSGHASHPHT